MGSCAVTMAQEPSSMRIPPRRATHDRPRFWIRKSPLKRPPRRPLLIGFATFVIGLRRHSVVANEEPADRDEDDAGEANGYEVEAHVDAGGCCCCRCSTADNDAQAPQRMHGRQDRAA